MTPIVLKFSKNYPYRQQMKMILPSSLGSKLGWRGGGGFSWNKVLCVGLFERYRSRPGSLGHPVYLILKLAYCFSKQTETSLQAIKPLKYSLRLLFFGGGGGVKVHLTTPQSTPTTPT